MSDSSHATNDITKVAEICFGSKIATLCTGPASSWNITDIVSAALEGIETGPNFSAAQLAEQKDKLQRLQLQGYHYPPCGDKIYPQIPGWLNTRINGQGHESHQTVVQVGLQVDPVSADVMETIQGHPVEEGRREEGRHSTRPHTPPPPGEVHHFHHISNTPNTMRAVNLLGESTTLLDTFPLHEAPVNRPASLPVASERDAVEVQPPPAENLLTTKHWGWDLHNLNKNMEEGWRIEELNMDVPPALTWRETDTGKAFLKKNVHPNLKKEYVFRFKVYNHVKKYFDGDTSAFMEALGSTRASYKEVQKYFKENRDN